MELAGEAAARFCLLHHAVAALTQPVQGDGSYGVFSTNVAYAQALVGVNT